MVEKFSGFMKHASLLLYAQKPFSEPCTEQFELNAHHHTLFLRYISI